MKALITTILALAALGANAARILWAALDESATIDSVAFRSYEDAQSRFVNAARLSVSSIGARQDEYAQSQVVQLALWIPEYGGDPGYWEEDFPVVCLRDDDGTYEMGDWSSQFNLGDDPNTSSTIFFELGYVDWDDDTAPFVTMATATATIQWLESEDPSIGKLSYIYSSGTLAPPGETNWKPTYFHAVPEPATGAMLLIGIAMLMKRRK